MPLRDHFHPPISDLTSWDGLHGQWPAMIVLDLYERLPPWYVASPRVHLGTAFEIDVATSERDEASRFAAERGAADGDNGAHGSVATAVWAPPEPTLAVTTEMPEQDEYEVRIFETEGRRLVAAVEIVSPANKDRLGSRRAFAAKCAALLGQGVSVSIVDLVTTRRSNLYGEMLDLLGLADPSLAHAPPSLYAVACRGRQHGKTWRVETWFHALAVGRPLPTLPLWLTADRAVPLDLEPSYERTCRVQRTP